MIVEPQKFGELALRRRDIDNPLSPASLDRIIPLRGCKILETTNRNLLPYRMPRGDTGIRQPKDYAPRVPRMDPTQRMDRRRRGILETASESPILGDSRRDFG